MKATPKGDDRCVCAYCQEQLKKRSELLRFRPLSVPCVSLLCNSGADHAGNGGDAAAGEKRGCFVTKSATGWVARARSKKGSSVV